MSAQIEPLGDWPVNVKSRLVLLIGSIPGQGTVQAWTVGDKRAILRDGVGPVLVVWPGEWSSSARKAVTQADRDRLLSQL